MFAAFRNHLSALFLAFAAALSGPAQAQENYFVTYSHQLEEPGNLEIASRTVTASPAGGNAFFSNQFEFEYGVKAWWTTELYLDGQSTAHDSTVFTGYKFENRFRPLLREHWINPVLYVEFANVNGADKSLREIVGNDGNASLTGGNDRSERKREVEMKLILSSNFKGWNVSENWIAEKDLKFGGPWEFGYAFGASRPLALKASSLRCTFCRENMALGAELYGGVGTTDGFGFRDTAHYLAPTFSLRPPAGPSFKLSPGFGLNSNSTRFLFRFGVSYEIEQIFSRLRRRK